MNIGDEVAGQVALGGRHARRSSRRRRPPRRWARTSTPGSTSSTRPLEEPKEGDLTAKAEPKGRATELGPAMLEAQKRQEQDGPADRPGWSSSRTSRPTPASIPWWPPAS